MGQPILAAAAFQAAPRSTTETRILTSLTSKGAASKGGCSQDWLPHVTYGAIATVGPARLGLLSALTDTGTTSPLATPSGTVTVTRKMPGKAPGWIDVTAASSPPI